MKNENIKITKNIITFIFVTMNLFKAERHEISKSCIEYTVNIFCDRSVAHNNIHARNDNDIVETQFILL